MQVKHRIAVYIHPQALVDPTGVGMLTLNMTLALAGNPAVELRLLVSSVELREDGMLPKDNPLHGIPAIGLPWGRRVRETCWLTLNKPSLDAYLTRDWWIYNTLETYVPARRCKRIVTVHHLEKKAPGGRFSKEWLRTLLSDLRVRRAVSTADLVVAQSTFTADQIRSEFGASCARIAVVGSGVDRDLLTATSAGPAPGQVAALGNYVIAPGAFQPRKGTDYLFATAQELQRRGSKVKVVCPFGLRGLLPFTEQVKSLSNVVALDYIDRSELFALIRGAVCMVIPSRLEGFGLTAIESMALGTPVIASNNSALPETLGGAGVLVNPADPIELADAVEKLCRDHDFRGRCVDLGRKRAADFTWVRCMERLLNAVSEVELAQSRS